jgi:mono/diheme cytochrome c family protein
MNKFIIILILLSFTMSLKAQVWIVPADKQGKLSPFKFTDETIKTGQRLFAVNCMSCHGTPGKGNYINLVPPPGDPATDKIQHNSDGEIFYKVAIGKGPMPSFKNALSATDIWNLISFLRSFNTKYVQSVMPVIKSAAYPGAVIGISLVLDKAKDLIVMRVTATGEKSIVPVKNAEVKLFVKRAFGLLLFDEEKTTDSQGIATFSVPKGLPGDSAGNVHLSARFVDEDLFSAVSKDTVLNAGIITIPESLVKNRAMWNTVRRAPVWVILTYGFGVLGVWGFIFYVLFKLRDIFVIGKHLNNRIREKTDINNNLNE